MPNQYNKCDKENIIQQLVKVQAEITVTPLVKHENPKVYCIDSCIKPNSDCCNQQCCNCNYCDCDYECCDCYNQRCCNCNYCNCDCCDRNPNQDTTCESGRSKTKCNYTLTQIICVEIPISIDADIDIKEGIVCCDRPNAKPIDK